MTYIPVPVQIPGKHPLEEVDVGLPLSRWLMEGETVSSFDIVWEPGITLTPPNRPTPAITNAGLIVFWLGDGTDGATYQGEVRFRTSEGRFLVVPMIIRVVNPTPNVPVE